MAAKKNEPREGRGEIVRLDPARAALAAAQAPEQAEAVRAKAEAMRVYLRSQDPAQVHELLLEAAEITVRAMRRIGELLPPAAPGTRTDVNPTSGPAVRRLDPRTETRYRAIAAIDEEAFEGALVDARDAGREITRTAVLALAPKRSRGQSVHPKRMLRRALAVLERAQKDLDAILGLTPQDPERMILRAATIAVADSAKDLFEATRGRTPDRLQAIESWLRRWSRLIADQLDEEPAAPSAEKAPDVADSLLRDIANDIEDGAERVRNVATNGMPYRALPPRRR